ncbi:aminotransferase class I/II-fold pyridoxal phosphate-dependent enzyme [Streptacidiphilus sp. PB12-B1b]|uniref:aminotransferase class I/II-fold pyridoxal phosphate-dependent enzyme n=1 Tax=Streptacidiphilus sp. PB12-B1b TaxID=2705012 RepID=UPI0015FCD16B|nr:aminotransferase class I/II-fold pyridoxal phosphate-dependent enzyme [Streptacidiphilus sp. PB12-B1b]QMU77875.1 aminotransferase class I/II-fold pyridoxal phosphate-dependent enzyme [Streptacidiphilus sp. PB12-B1b]
MTRPWYQDFFTEDFWAVAEHEYTPGRTEAEADYLASALAGAPGRRVLDLGCGTGRHAVALARRGFRVTGVDAVGWALERAAASATAAGVRVDWLHLDLLRELPWPVEEFDAVVCLQSFGWGSDAQQLRLLREARRALVPGGLLLLDHSNALAIAARYQPEAVFETEGLRADFRRSLRVVSGRSAGSIEVRRAGRAPVVVRDDVRLYQPAEVGALLSRAGLVVERVEADFTAGREVTAASRYVQFTARRPAPPPAAIDTWRPDAPAGADDSALDLRWSPDEAGYVRAAVERACRELGPELLTAYHVTDPFAGRQSAPVLSEHFGVELTPDMVTAGSGATGLLHALAALSLPGPVLYLEDGHPDLPHWAAALGAETVAASRESLVDSLDRHAPALLVLDHPSITGDLRDRAELERTVRAARERGAVVVLDEAYATYAGPAASCVPAVAEHDNLVVLRSMSKGYCCGGLRIGFALASPGLTRRLRETAPPLAANSAGLAVALRLLAEGDVFAALRARIAEVKPEAAAALRRAGIELTEGAPCLPWLTAPADDHTRAVLAKRGLRAKPVGERLLKIAVPLSEDRLDAFREAVADAR